MKNDIPTTYRTSQEKRDKLETLWGNKNTGSSMAVDFYLALRSSILKQMEAKVDGDDIACLANVLQRSPIDTQYMSSSKSLIAKITLRAEQLTDEKDKQLKSNMLLLAEKAKNFTPPECYVLQEEIHRRLALKS